MDYKGGVSQKKSLQTYRPNEPDTFYSKDHLRRQRKHFFTWLIRRALIPAVKRRIAHLVDYNTSRTKLSERQVRPLQPENIAYFEKQKKISENLPFLNQYPTVLRPDEQSEPNKFLFDPSRDIKPDLIENIAKTLDKNIRYLWVLKQDQNNNPVLRLGYEYKQGRSRMGHPTLIDDDERYQAIVGGELFFDKKNQCWCIDNDSGRYGSTDSKLLSSHGLTSSDLMNFVADQFEKKGILVRKIVNHDVPFRTLIKYAIKKPVFSKKTVIARPSNEETISQWVDSVLLESRITSNRTYSQRRIKIELGPAQLDYYVALQETIASLIPHEADRPTIDLFVRGSKVSHKTKACKVGMLGGIGSLADAHIVYKAVQRLKDQSVDLESVSFNLFSCPPPRKKKEIIKRGRAFVYNLLRFGIRRHAHFTILSNTGHLHAQKLRMLGFTPLTHLVDLISDTVSKQNTQGVLILSTTRANQHNLYSKRLRRKKVKCFTVSSDYQQKIQQVIDNIKIRPNDAERERLINLIIEIVTEIFNNGENLSHILLGCTELPLLLGDSGIDCLKKKLGVVVNDSAREMIDQVCTLMH